MVILTDKSKMAPKPYKTWFSFKKGPWYLFPQRTVWMDHFTNITYHKENVHKHSTFPMVYRYEWTWLFVVYNWQIKIGTPEETYQRQTQVTYKK